MLLKHLYENDDSELPMMLLFSQNEKVTEKLSTNCQETPQNTMENWKTTIARKIIKIPFKNPSVELF